MKNKRFITIIVMIIAFLALWFSGVLPEQAVKVVAGNYISKHGNGAEYKFKDAEYSPAHNCYFAYYEDENNPNAETRNIGVYYRWFPAWVYFDSAFPGIM